MKRQIPPNVQARFDNLLHVCGVLLKLQERVPVSEETGDVIPYLIRLCADSKSAYELLPYLLAIRHFDSNFKLPNLPMWIEAAAIADAYVPLNTDSARNASINPVYNTPPPSSAAQRQMDDFVAKGAYSRSNTQVEPADKADNKKERFSEE